jgi:hypothetical protein
VLPQYKTNTNLGVGLGWVVMIAGNLLTRNSPLPWPGIVIFALGFAAFIWGCVQYAKGKGHSGYWGALGVLWIVGLLVLVFLPDRHKGAT